MKMLRIKNNWIIVTTGIVILIFVFTVLKIYDFTLNESKTIHQRQQLEMAKSATAGIMYYLDQLEEDIQSLSRLTKFTKVFETFLHDQLKKEVVNSIFIYDEHNLIKYSAGAELPGWLPEWFDQIAGAADNHKIEKLIYSSVRPDEETLAEKKLSFAIVVPLEQDNPNPDVNRKNYSSVLGYVVNFDWLMQKFIRPLKLTSSDFAWVLDGDGRLIFHPHHSEMLLRSTKEAGAECLPCHRSFQVQNKMLEADQLLAEYFIEGEPPKIFASVPLELNQQKWIFAISTYLPDVTSNVRNNFMLVLVLSGIVILLIVLIGVTFFSINTKRIRLEESERHLEQSQLLQEKLHQASKLASIGEFVDNVAHEINTPTGIISAEADTIMLQENISSNVLDEIRIIKEQTRRISGYTRSLLNYSRRIPFKIEQNDLPAVVEECLFLLGPRLRSEKVSIERNFPEIVMMLNFDKNRIEQVFINVLNNSMDSMTGQGKIIIEVYEEREQVTENESKLWAIVEISDNGQGIPEENIPQIFETFFSTKPVSKGTGLGLSIVRAIVKRHGGKIEVDSKVNIGTTIKILLPFDNNQAEWNE